MTKFVFEPAEEFTLSPTQVRKIRVMAGLSKVGLARVLGMSYQSVWRWETGQNGVSGDAAYKLVTLAQSRGIEYE